MVAVVDNCWVNGVVRLRPVELTSYAVQHATLAGVSSPFQVIREVRKAWKS